MKVWHAGEKDGRSCNVSECIWRTGVVRDIQLYRLCRGLPSKPMARFYMKQVWHVKEKTGEVATFQNVYGGRESLGISSYICFVCQVLLDSELGDLENEHVNLNVNLPNGLRAAVGKQMYFQVDQQYVS
jgi:hypothetical protein